MRKLQKSHLLNEPLGQFANWFDQAQAAGVPLPEAMTLATVDGQGFPQARIVLLRGLTDSGFVFFTNHNSQKGADLAATPHAALIFHWPALDRQVRIRGEVQKISPAGSDAYFKSRPRGSQVGAWASPQSQVIPDRAFLDKLYQDAEGQFAGKTIPRPPHWGGYQVTPIEVEFWQGSPDRLHDRLRYQRSTGVEWEIVRLAP